MYHISTVTFSQHNLLGWWWNLGEGPTGGVYPWVVHCKDLSVEQWSHRGCCYLGELSHGWSQAREEGQDYKVCVLCVCVCVVCGVCCVRACVCACMHFCFDPCMKSVMWKITYLCKVCRLHHRLVQRSQKESSTPDSTPKPLISVDYNKSQSSDMKGTYMSTWALWTVYCSELFGL